MPDKFSEVILILVGSTLIILVLITLVIATLFINQKRKFRHSLQLTDLKNEYDRELLKAQLEIQSQTFETISRELHDNAGTLLSMAMLHLKTIPESNAATNGKMLEVHELINEAMDMLRDVSRSLHPEHIAVNGWQRSFLNELDRISRTKLFSIRTVIEGEPFTIEDTKQIILFRILQEAINNIVKHAEATEVEVMLLYNNAHLEIVIKDNGKGMHTTSGSSTVTGSGLRNMKARAAMLPATLNVESTLNQGTSLTIRYHNDTTKTNGHGK